MDWNAAVDLYCERLGPGLWAEPLNAATNAAFLVAAWALGPHARGSRALQALRGLIAAIGLASLAFHLLATEATGWLDTGFIGLYMLVYLPVWLHRVAHWPAGASLMGAPALLGWIWAVASAVRASGAPVPGLYAAAASALLVLVVWSWRRQATSARWMLAAVATFAVSLTARQLDLPWCGAWPWGTHFAWHLLNGLTLYATVRAVAAARPRVPAA